MMQNGTASSPSPEAIATFAGGCFWGMQKWYKKEFGDALLDSSVGYIGGEDPEPNYHGVCSGKTGHAEALRVIFDPSKTSYEKLCEYFFRIHDPTTLNRQGNDVGSQYRSAIFAHTKEQVEVAQKVLDRMNKERFGGKIVTTIDLVVIMKESPNIKITWNAIPVVTAGTDRFGKSVDRLGFFLPFAEYPAQTELTFSHKPVCSFDWLKEPNRAVKENKEVSCTRLGV